MGRRAKKSYGDTVARNIRSTEKDAQRKTDTFRRLAWEHWFVTDPSDRPDRMPSNLEDSIDEWLQHTRGSPFFRDVMDYTGITYVTHSDNSITIEDNLNGGIVSVKEVAEKKKKKRRGHRD